MKITYQKADARGKQILAVHDSRETSMGWEATVITPFASARGETLDAAVEAALALKGSGVCPDWQDKKYRGVSTGYAYPGHLPIPAKAEEPASVAAPTSRKRAADPAPAPVADQPVSAPAAVEEPSVTETQEPAPAQPES